MRFPVPDKFEPKYVGLFVAALFLVQQIEHTSIMFSSLCALYTILFALAFNGSGGLLYLSGAFIFFNGTLTALLGLVVKCVLGEPGDSNLLNPEKTMLVYCAGMLVMGVAGYVSHLLIPKRGLLSGLAAGETMMRAAAGCLLLGVFIQLITAGAGGPGTLASALGQLNHFIQMAIILATTYQIRHSGGKSSTNWVVFTAGGWTLFFGLIAFSKEGMFLPFITWLIPAMALRYSFSKAQVIGGALLAMFMLYYMVPYSQYVRLYRDENGSAIANTETALVYLSNLNETRRLYLQQEQSVKDTEGLHYYDTDQGLFDRTVMLPIDDALISYTDQGNVFGLLPVYVSFLNVLPHFLLPNKVSWASGNVFAREIGVIGSGDTFTGISFSPAADAYHEATWFGVLIVEPLVMFLLFFSVDALTGSVRESPWALLPISMASHIAPEGLLGGAIYLMTYGTAALIFVALLAKYVLPLVSGVLLGLERTRVQKTVSFKPMVLQPRLARLPSASGSETTPL